MSYGRAFTSDRRLDELPRHTEINPPGFVRIKTFAALTALLGVALLAPSLASAAFTRPFLRQITRAENGAGGVLNTTPCSEAERAAPGSTCFAGPDGVRSIVLMIFGWVTVSVKIVLMSLNPLMTATILFRCCLSKLSLSPTVWRLIV